MIAQSSASGKILRTSNKSQMLHGIWRTVRNNCSCAGMIDGLQVNISDSYFTLHSTIPLTSSQLLNLIETSHFIQRAASRDLVFVPTAKVSDRISVAVYGFPSCNCLINSVSTYVCMIRLKMVLEPSSPTEVF